MKSWKDNVFKLLRTGDSGKCPYCDSEDTAYRLKIMNQSTNMGYGVIWCNSCKSAFNISRVLIQKDMEKAEIKVPNNLNYKSLY